MKVRRIRRQDRPPSEATLVCYEAYQVVGSLLFDLRVFDSPEAERILDNLSQARLVHRNVLPWPSFAEVK
jgi:predicted N-acetyltransferase YhbS